MPSEIHFRADDGIVVTRFDGTCHTHDGTPMYEVLDLERQQDAWVFDRVGNQQELRDGRDARLTEDGLIVKDTLIDCTDVMFVDDTGMSVRREDRLDPAHFTHEEMLSGSRAIHTDP